MKKTCFENFSWSNINKIEKYSIGIEAFTRIYLVRMKVQSSKVIFIIRILIGLKLGLTIILRKKFYLIWVYIPPYYYLVFYF